MKRKLDETFIKSIDALRALDGGEALDGLVDSLCSDGPSVAVRVNRAKGSVLPPGKRRVSWAVNGAYIDGERPRFTFDPAMHQGRYYVQDASSMVMETIVREIAGEEPVVYIDACAAPGGKTTAAIGNLPAGSLVIANEYDRRRADALRENIIKWGYSGAVVTSCDTSGFARLHAIADIVAADVPCSGEGMMRKESAAVEQWSPALVAQCAALQREIVGNMWKALKPGGYFIYSTCTFNRTENEDNLTYIIEELGGEPVDMKLSERFAAIAPAIGCPYPAARFIPGRAEGEGLFIAVVRKPSDSTLPPARRNETKLHKEKSAAKGKDATASVDRWITADGHVIVNEGDIVAAYPSAWAGLIAGLKRTVNVIYAGVQIATVKGHDLVPTQALALSDIIDISAFATVDVDYGTALQYLSRQAITLADAPRGIVLLMYDSHPLGFVKNLGNRANNLYPQAWAIKSTHIPEERPHISDTD